MVRFVSVRELKNRLSEMIRRSRKGDVVVTSRGRPQAILHAVREEEMDLKTSYRESGRRAGMGMVREKPAAPYETPGHRKAGRAVGLPIVVERDEDGFYVVECPLFSGCYTQGKTVDEALKNIREAIDLCLEEKENQDRLRNYHPREISYHTLIYA